MWMPLWSWLVVLNLTWVVAQNRQRSLFDSLEFDSRSRERNSIEFNSFESDELFLRGRQNSFSNSNRNNNNNNRNKFQSSFQSTGQANRRNNNVRNLGFSRESNSIELSLFGRNNNKNNRFSQTNKRPLNTFQNVRLSVDSPEDNSIENTFGNRIVGFNRQSLGFSNNAVFGRDSNSFELKNFPSTRTLTNTNRNKNSFRSQGRRSQSDSIELSFRQKNRNLNSNKVVNSRTSTNNPFLKPRFSAESIEINFPPNINNNNRNFNRNTNNRLKNNRFSDESIEINFIPNRNTNKNNRNNRFFSDESIELKLIPNRNFNSNSNNNRNQNNNRNNNKKTKLSNNALILKHFGNTLKTQNGRRDSFSNELDSIEVKFVNTNTNNRNNNRNKFKPKPRFNQQGFRIDSIEDNSFEIKLTGNKKNPFVITRSDERNSRESLEINLFNRNNNRNQNQRNKPKVNNNFRNTNSNRGFRRDSFSKESIEINLPNNRFKSNFNKNIALLLGNNKQGASNANFPRKQSTNIRPNNPRRFNSVSLEDLFDDSAEDRRRAQQALRTLQQRNNNNRNNANNRNNNINNNRNFNRNNAFTTRKPPTSFSRTTQTNPFLSAAARNGIKNSNSNFNSNRNNNKKQNSRFPTLPTSSFSRPGANKFFSNKNTLVSTNKFTGNRKPQTQLFSNSFNFNNNPFLSRSQQSKSAVRTTTRRPPKATTRRPIQTTTRRPKTTKRPKTNNRNSFQRTNGNSFDPFKSAVRLGNAIRTTSTHKNQTKSKLTTQKNKKKSSKKSKKKSKKTIPVRTPAGFNWPGGNGYFFRMRTGNSKPIEYFISYDD